MAKLILSYDEFKQEIVDRINEELEDRNPRLTAVLRMVPKVNGMREALNFNDEASELHYSPNFYIRDYYERYNEGVGVDGIVRQIVNTYLDVEGWRIFEDGDYSGPEYADKVVYTLVNRKGNEDILKMIPHRDYLDLAVIYRVVVKLDGRSLFSYILNNEVLKSWNMTEDEIFERAKVQTDVILEPDDSVSDGFGILTNAICINGSSVLLNTERLMKMADFVGNDLYLIPSSINEFFSIPADDMFADVLKESIRNSVKEGLTSPDEWLSFNLYRFSRETKEVSIV